MAKKNRDRRKKSSGGFTLSGPWPWVVGGAVVLLLLFFLARTLSTTVSEVAPTPILATANPDLTAMTRMMGDISLDTTRTAGLPDEVLTQFARVDSMMAERSWYDAIEALGRLQKSVPEDKVDVVHDYIGYCQHQAANPDRALREFRKALDAAGNDTTRARMAFCIGYLFQSRGYADSAFAFYDLARHAAPPGSTDVSRPALLNNLGVARETLGDTTAAFGFYREAAALLDTSGADRSARTLRDNLRRTYRPASDSTPSGS